MTPSLVRVLKTLTKASVKSLTWCTNVLRLGNEDELFILFASLDEEFVFISKHGRRGNTVLELEMFKNISARFVHATVKSFT